MTDKKLEEIIDNLIPKLRGIYTIPVNDVAGLLDDKDTFTRQFSVPPINIEAAQLIQDQQARIEELEEIITG